MKCAHLQSRTKANLFVKSTLTCEVDWLILQIANHMYSLLFSFVLLTGTIALLPTHSSMLTAMIVEPKLSVQLVDSLLNARAHLKHEYDIVLLTLAQNWPFFEQPIWHSLNVKLMRNESVPKSIQQYSDKLIGCEFWKHFSTDFVLIFQTDSRFCSGSAHNIEQFMMFRYPYIGAPWFNGGVGNGGFSLRLLEATLDACNSSVRGKVEDMYFYNYFKTHAKRWPNAPRAIADKFSSELYFAKTESGAPLGIHKSHKYQKDGRLSRVCPEFNLLAQKV